MTSNSADLQSLFGQSGLEEDAVDALNAANNNLGPAIMAGLGDVTIDDIEGMGATEVLLLHLLVDDSSSIAYAGNTQLVIDGYNGVLDALDDSKSSSAILIGCQLLNSGVVYPFVPLERAVRLTTGNYAPCGGTPLYDRMATVLAGSVAKMSELEDGGVAVRGATFVITDGCDVGSRSQSPQQLKPVIDSMLRTEAHIVGAVGIDDGETDFRAVFASMGIRDQWIQTPKNSASDIRRAFGTISKSAVRASQAAGNFSQTALGGF